MQVRLVPSDTGWYLPRFVPAQDIYNTDLPAACRLMQEQLGIHQTVCYALRLSEPANNSPINVYVMDTHSPSNLAEHQPSDGSRWFSHTALVNLALQLPRERAVLEAWFAQVEGGKALPSLNLPWWNDGWFLHASQELEERAREQGRAPVAPAELLRSAATGAVLRILTDRGYLYQKYIPDSFLQEVPLTRRLAAQYPAHLPVLLAAERESLLMEDMNGSPFGAATPFARWEAFVHFYASLQLDSISDLSAWQTLGCVDLRVSSVAESVELLLGDLEQRLFGLPQKELLDVSLLRSQAPKLRDWCRKLEESGLPDTLEHGDLHAGNILLTDKGHCLYDWSHACVTCPFYGFDSLFAEDNWFPEDAEAVARLRQAYLEPFSAHLSTQTLETAYAAWTPLRPLFQLAHQSRVIKQFQTAIGGLEYVSETATGNTLEYFQWWLLQSARQLLSNCAG